VDKLGNTRRSRAFTTHGFESKYPLVSPNGKYFPKMAS